MNGYVNLNPESDDDTGPFVNVNAIAKMEVRYCAKNVNPPGIALYSLRFVEKMLDSRGRYTIVFSDHSRKVILADPDRKISQILERIFLEAKNPG